MSLTRKKEVMTSEIIIFDESKVSVGDIISVEHKTPNPYTKRGIVISVSNFELVYKYISPDVKEGDTINFIIYVDYADKYNLKVISRAANRDKS